MAGREQKDTAHATLSAKRKELATARKELANAQASFDTNAAVAATQRIGVLEDFIRRLETESASVADADAAQAAKAWIRDNAPTDDLRKQIADVQERAQKQLAALIATVEEETRLRASLQQHALATNVLQSRFPDTKMPTTRAVSVPQLVDYAGPLVRATDVQHRRRRGLVVARTASATPEMVRRDTLRAVAQFVGSHGHTLPKEVLAILRAAPIPEDVLPQPKQRSAGEERAEAQIARDVQETKRVLDALPGSVAGLGAF